MSIYRMTSQFNLEDDKERSAAEFLKELDCGKFKSRNQFVIELISAYMDKTAQEQSEDSFVEKLKLMFREEIADISVVAPEQKKATAAVTELTEEQKAEKCRKCPCRFRDVRLMSNTRFLMSKRIFLRM